MSSKTSDKLSSAHERFLRRELGVESCYPSTVFKQKILVSSRLLGNPVRYNGRDAKPGSDLLERWTDEGRVVGVCPELEAGFSVPREAAEIRGGDGLDVLNGRARVVTQGDRDLTSQFVFGARQALEVVRQHSIRIAILTDGSPSCGSTYIYDGSFADARLSGSTGVTAALLRLEGLDVFSQHQLHEAAQRLLELESAQPGHQLR